MLVPAPWVDPAVLALPVCPELEPVEPAAEVEPLELELDEESFSSSDEETEIVEGELSSRSGHTIKSKFERKVMKLSHMKKQDLIDECMRRNIACVGTVRVLRERLRIAREEEQA